MKLETESDPSLLFFAGAERVGGNSARCSRCSSGDEGSAERAQDKLTSPSSSIAKPLQVLTITDPQLRASWPGECGCGSSAPAGLHDDIQNKEDNPQRDDIRLTTEKFGGNRSTWDALPDNAENRGPHSVLDYDSFLFIDDDPEENEGLSGADSVAKNCHRIVPLTVENACDTSRKKCAENASPSPEGRHLQEDDDAKVSGPNFDSVNRSDTESTRPTIVRDSCMRRCVGAMDSDIAHFTPANDTAMTGADGETRVQSPVEAPPECKRLKSVLKKSKNLAGKVKSRVTFDESVILYSDELESVQILALRSAADITCPDVFCMFEPPIEYQDLQPFDPPAEYRDPEDHVPFYSDIVLNPKQPSSEDSVPSEIVKAPEESSSSLAPEREPILQEVQKSSVIKEPEEKFMRISEDQKAPNCLIETNDMPLKLNEESDKLFERFLEAEREFAEDDELNNVFHVLEEDLTSDSQNGGFDDNFFRKLINLLSSVEGDIQLADGDFFSSTDFTVNDAICNLEGEDGSQTPSRNLSEADSDCSISSQDTIIVRLGNEDSNHAKDSLLKQTSEKDLSSEDLSCQEWNENNLDATELRSECSDDVFNETGDEKLEESDSKLQQTLAPKDMPVKMTTQPSTQIDKVNGENLSRQSSSEQAPSGVGQDPIQDADDSTSSDSRSGEVEEDIRLDDIGYDEEDADDYDDECLRGMVQGNSKIRRIIKKNALQCSLLRGIEARRRQPGLKYARPKSPLPSQDSLVEQLKWLTTVDENKDLENPSIQSKPPDVILSTGNVHLNGTFPHGASSEEELNNRSFQPQRHPLLHPTQPRRLLATNSKGIYIVHPSGFPPQHHPQQLRQWIPPSNDHPQIQQHNPSSYPDLRSQPAPSQLMTSEQRVLATVTLPRDFRDWRVIQKVVVNRDPNPEVNTPHFSATLPSASRRCSNGVFHSYQRGSVIPPDVSMTSKTGPGGDELEQFVQQDIKRIERIRQRYSLAEEDDDPTFGFARRPSVRGIQSRLGHTAALVNHINSNTPTSVGARHLASQLTASYAKFTEPGRGPVLMHARVSPPQGTEIPKVWNRLPSWNTQNIQTPLYTHPANIVRTQHPPMHIHRASVALSELPGSVGAHSHPKLMNDTRYHSYAENMYGSGRIGPHQGWAVTDLRTCVPPENATTQHFLQEPLPPPAAGATVTPVSLQVPPHAITAMVKDERGVPEGASSSPKVSSDSLYHPSEAEAIPVNDAHKKDGIIYYSLNV